MNDLSLIEAKVNATRRLAMRTRLTWRSTRIYTHLYHRYIRNGGYDVIRREDADDEGLNVVSLSRRTIVKSSDTDHDAYIGYVHVPPRHRQTGRRISRTTKHGPLSLSLSFHDTLYIPYT